MLNCHFMAIKSAKRILMLLLICSSLLLGANSFAVAQQPFNTDDIGVTPRHHWHFELANEFDIVAAESYPNLRQNTANLKVAFGLFENLEVGVDNQAITIMNANSLLLERNVFGMGDLDFSVKYKFLKEKEGSKRPGLAASFAIEYPTGDASRQLGSGLRDYVGNLIAQFPLTDKTKLRFNAGLVFAGNTQTGAIGLKTRGTVYTGGASVTHQFTDKLLLGVELTGEATSNFDLGRGAILGLAGGNYSLRKNMTLDFAVSKGTFPGAPRAGALMGISVDF
jgi:hypothetical protein